MQLLKDILLNVHPLEIKGETSIEVKGIAIDSRKVEKGYVFVAVRGTLVDGHQYIDSAISQGAVAIVCESLPESVNNDVTYILVPNAAEAAGHIAANFYGNPSNSLKVVGVTGTNGKTTTATLLYQLFTALGYKCGLISTVQNFIASVAESSTHTTPDAVSIQSLLARMA